MEIKLRHPYEQIKDILIENLERLREVANKLSNLEETLMAMPLPLGGGTLLITAVHIDSLYIPSSDSPRLEEPRWWLKGAWWRDDRHELEPWSEFWELTFEDGSQLMLSCKLRSRDQIDTQGNPEPFSW